MKRNTICSNCGEKILLTNKYCPNCAKENKAYVSKAEIDANELKEKEFFNAIMPYADVKRYKWGGIKTVVDVTVKDNLSIEEQYHFISLVAKYTKIEITIIPYGEMHCGVFSYEFKIDKTFNIEYFYIPIEVLSLYEPHENITILYNHLGLDIKERDYCTTLNQIKRINNTHLLPIIIEMTRELKSLYNMSNIEQKHKYVCRGERNEYLNKKFGCHRVITKRHIKGGIRHV